MNNHNPRPQLLREFIDKTRIFIYRAFIHPNRRNTFFPRVALVENDLIESDRIDSRLDLPKCDEIFSFLEDSCILARKQVRRVWPRFQRGNNVRPILPKVSTPLGLAFHCRERSGNRFSVTSERFLFHVNHDVCCTVFQGKRGRMTGSVKFPKNSSCIAPVSCTSKVKTDSSTRIVRPGTRPTIAEI